MDFTAIKNGIQKLIVRCAPSDCLLCQMPLLLEEKPNQLCQTCEGDIERYPLSWDMVFEQPIKVAQLQCGNLAGITAIHTYQWPLDRAVQQLKFNQQFWHARLLGRWLNEQLSHLMWPTFDFVCAIPLHRSRLIQRGYNQSQLILDRIPVLANCQRLTALKRIKATTPQSEMSRRERLANLKHAFKCDRDLTGKTVLLIDDVLTTGATLEQAAKVLLACNATAVYAAVAAIRPFN